VPYELCFSKRVSITDRDEYFNECCVGGDVVVDHLLPAMKARYSAIQSNQEDWGWFIWFQKGKVGLAIDVHTDDPDAGAFRIHLTSRVKGMLWREKVEDTPELEELLALVTSELAPWVDSAISSERIAPD
jgi:hypothetical protein